MEIYFLHKTGRTKAVGAKIQQGVSQRESCKKHQQAALMCGLEKTGRRSTLTRWNNTMLDTNTQTSQESHLAQLIVRALNLDVRADDIDPLAPLFSEGLGLDSIDILEIALAVSQAYGVKLRSDDENNAAIFQSLRSLSDDIQRRRSA